MPELICSTLVAMLTDDDKVPAHSCCLTKEQARAGTGYPEAQFISFSGLWFLICTIVSLAGLKRESMVGVECWVEVESAAAF